MTHNRSTLEYLIRQDMQFDHLFLATYVGNDFHDTRWSKEAVISDGIAGNRNDPKSRLMRHLDLTPAIAAYPTEETFFRFDGHLTAKGSAAAAAAILEALTLDCPAPAG